MNEEVSVGESITQSKEHYCSLSLSLHYSSVAAFRADERCRSVTQLRFPLPQKRTRRRQGRPPLLSLLSLSSRLFSPPLPSHPRIRRQPAERSAEETAALCFCNSSSPALYDVLFLSLFTSFSSPPFLHLLSLFTFFSFSSLNSSRPQTLSSLSPPLFRPSLSLPLRRCASAVETNLAHAWQSPLLSRPSAPPVSLALERGCLS